MSKLLTRRFQWDFAGIRKRLRKCGPIKIGSGVDQPGDRIVCPVFTTTSSNSALKHGRGIEENNTMSDLSKNITSLQRQTALDLFLWLKEEGIGFRIDFSHLSNEHVLVKYLKVIQAEEDTRQRSANDGSTQDAREEDPDCS